MLARLRSVLGPGIRLRIYQSVAVVASLLTGYGLVHPDVANTWLALVVAAGDGAAMLMAMINTRRWSRGLLYGAALAVTTSLVGTGLLTDAQASAGMQAVTAVLGLAGVWLAAYRTDASTPTGQPADEIATAPVDGYVGRHEG